MVIKFSVRTGHAILPLALLTVVVAVAPCGDAVTCKRELDSVLNRLTEMQVDKTAREGILVALEKFRTGVLEGKRVELPSAQRQHLERGNPYISDVSFDSRHRPLSTNASRHFKPMITLAEDSEVLFHRFLQRKEKGSTNKGNASPPFLLTLAAQSKLSVWALSGNPALRDFDLGHGKEAVIQLEISASQEKPVVVTADSGGNVRAHEVSVLAPSKSNRPQNKEQSAGETLPQKKPILNVSMNFHSAFSLPQSVNGGEVRKLNAVLPFERGAQLFFVTGDSLGGIAVFFRNGTLKGRAKVTEDPGGVQGLVRSQGQTILFWSSHTFGYFSAAQVDVQSAPCSGWNSPAVDVIVDPTNVANRVLVSLSDGDALIYTTTQGKSKTCDLTLKFPRVSVLPLRLHSFRGQVLGLPTPQAVDTRQANCSREIFVFNLAPMAAGYGAAPSKVVSLQASFKPKQPSSLEITVAASAQERSMGFAAVQFVGYKGVEVFDVNMKPPPAPKTPGGGSDDGWTSWLNWIPKIGVFGVALIGVVFWNIKKTTNQKTSSPRLDDINEKLFAEKLRKTRAAKAASAGVGANSRLDDGSSRVEEVKGDSD